MLNHWYRSQDGFRIPRSDSPLRAKWDADYIQRVVDYFGHSGVEFTPIDVPVNRVAGGHTVMPSHPRTEFYTKLYKLGERVPPIVVSEIGTGHYNVLDGNRRITSAVAAGKSHVPGLLIRPVQTKKPAPEPKAPHVYTNTKARRLGKSEPKDEVQQVDDNFIVDLSKSERFAPPKLPKRIAQALWALHQPGVLTDELRKPEYRENPNPFAGHCFVASNALLHLIDGARTGWQMKCIHKEHLKNEDTHWYLQHKKTGHILDATADQFEGDDILYEKGIAKGTSQTGADVGHPTKRAQVVIDRVRSLLDGPPKEYLGTLQHDGNEWYIQPPDEELGKAERPKQRMSLDEAHKKYRYFHLSGTPLHNVAGDWLARPRIPRNTMQGEDVTTPRTCVGRTIPHCIAGIEGSTPRYDMIKYYRGYHVYGVPRTAKVVEPSPEQVPDVGNTGERWLTQPTKLQHIGRIASGEHPEEWQNYTINKAEWWHGTPSGDLRGGISGLHVGTRQAAEEALHARIGYPAEGEWDGTREYGKTKLAGYKTLVAKGKARTGFNSTGLPEEDFYPDPKRMPTFSSGVSMLPTHKPNILQLDIVGKMTNTPYNPHNDYRANGMMAGQLKRGTAKRGYYYTNVAEDEGSVSAVLPGPEHVKPFQKRDLDPSLGYEIRHKIDTDSPDSDNAWRVTGKGKYATITAHLGDKQVGQLDIGVSQAYPGHIRPVMVEVHPKHRRKGIATAMYQRAEQIFGLPAIQGASQSKAAKALWAQKARPFGQPFQKRDLDPSLGYKISSQPHPAGLEVLAHDAQGNQVGRSLMRHHPSGSLQPALTYVDEGHQRRGIASAMYAHASKVTGKSVVPDEVQSEDAEKLWQAKQWAQPMGKAERPAFPQGAMMRSPAFRHVVTGQIIETPVFHDTGYLPPGEDTSPHWEDGFVDHEGKFYGRRAAAEAVGATESRPGTRMQQLESVSYGEGFKEGIYKAEPKLSPGGLRFKSADGNTEEWDYSHLLPEKARQDGYRVRVRTFRAPPEGVTSDTNRIQVFATKTQEGRSRPAGQLIGHWNRKVLHPWESRVEEQDRRKHLGLAMYEAMYTHARAHFGADTVAGDHHSTSAHLVHKKLSAKHGLNYEAEANVGRDRPYSDMDEWRETPPHDSDARYGKYRYKLPDVAKAEPIDPFAESKKDFDLEAPRSLHQMDMPLRDFHGYRVYATEQDPSGYVENEDVQAKVPDAGLTQEAWSTRPTAMKYVGRLVVPQQVPEWANPEHEDYDEPRWFGDDDPGMKLRTTPHYQRDVTPSPQGQLFGKAEIDQHESVAAVVMVQDGFGRTLWGKRRKDGKYTMPGGHADRGETPAAAAVRELHEEAGLTPETMWYLGSANGSEGPVFAYHAIIHGQPTIENDPDREMESWIFVDCLMGPPAYITANLAHHPDIVYSLLGWPQEAPAAQPEPTEGGAGPGQG